MRTWSDYIDEYGLVTHLTPDGRHEGGDGGQRLGMYHIAKRLLGEFDQYDFLFALKHIEIEPGIYIRHPNSTEPWHSDPKEFSRDQQTPLVIAMGLCGLQQNLKPLFHNHLKRFGKYQNKDFAGPEHWGQYIRAFRAWWLYPILWFTDIFMILGVMIRCFIAKQDPDDVGDDLNLILSLIQAKEILATPFSYLARRYYVANRPQNLGNRWYKVHPIQGALNWYFREDTGAPPMDELYKPIVDKYFLDQ